MSNFTVIPRTPAETIQMLKREVADLKLQMVAMHEHEADRVRQERRVIKRMPKTEAIDIYPEYGEMLQFLLDHGTLPAFTKLTVKQQVAVRSVLGIGAQTNGVYDALRKAVNAGLKRNDVLVEMK